MLAAPFQSAAVERGDDDDYNNRRITADIILQNETRSVHNRGVRPTVRPSVSAGNKLRR